jgi:hypothetical protein
MDYIDETHNEICRACDYEDEYPECALQCYGFLRRADEILQEKLKDE